MIQCFVEENKKFSCNESISLRFLYACKTEKTHSVLPRVMHVHNDRLEIMFICEGEGTYTIGENRYLVSSGDILIYNSGVIHDEISDPNARIKSYCIGIDRVQLTGLPTNCLISNEESPVLKVAHHFTLIQSIFATIYDELYYEKEGAGEVCYYLTQALIFMLLRMFKQGTTTEKENKQKLGERIKKYIDQNYNEQITLTSISTSLNISSDYMSHVFKQTTGYSPIQYIMRRRIGEAQTLLITTKYSITMIATMVGYDNSSYFNKIFNKNVGMSPKRYRECYTKKE
ncbi:AraC family transcriptional regulator [Clostridium sp. MB40-C1]|uniref:AraC family transcriptional regulator n=1 Tax=Clostridium sp. MB40-C1 TaxID=3070996 RepID=UPI0027E0C123|nr:AraC family transcriptional regulator [Clostridium sp. MB40-C1]WMJ80705.1 AraC family transcriptional regulator [Clostridium sp. MB40-C1]